MYSNNFGEAEIFQPFFIFWLFMPALYFGGFVAIAAS